MKEKVPGFRCTFQFFEEDKWKRRIDVYNHRLMTPYKFWCLTTVGFDARGGGDPFYPKRKEVRTYVSADFDEIWEIQKMERREGRADCQVEVLPDVEECFKRLKYLLDGEDGIEERKTVLDG